MRAAGFMTGRFLFFFCWRANIILKGRGKRYLRFWGRSYFYDGSPAIFFLYFSESHQIHRSNRPRHPLSVVVFGALYFLCYPAGLGSGIGSSTTHLLGIHRFYPDIDQA